MLCALSERREARRWAHGAGGRPLARAMTAYQLAATELALAHQRLARGGATPGEFEARRRADRGDGTGASGDLGVTVAAPAQAVVWW